MRHLGHDGAELLPLSGGGCPNLVPEPFDLGLRYLEAWGGMSYCSFYRFDTPDSWGEFFVGPVDVLGSVEVADQVEGSDHAGDHGSPDLFLLPSVASSSSSGWGFREPGQPDLTNATVASGVSGQLCVHPGGFFS